jgi:hypothetical protein
MNPKRTLYAIVILAPFVALSALGGCTTNEPDRGDAGVPERDECTLRVRACINSCDKADLGIGCKACCRRNGISCDMGGNYSFYSCPE